MRAMEFYLICFNKMALTEMIYLFVCLFLFTPCFFFKLNVSFVKSERSSVMERNMEQSKQTTTKNHQIISVEIISLRHLQ